MNRAFLSIGSNMGDRFAFLQEAVRELMTEPHVTVDNVSSVYETDPVGYTDQAAFLNIAVGVTTTLSAHELLEVCQKIEQHLGRKRIIRWGPRTVDLDILVYNEENIESDVLQIPHPRMKERAFVVIPLASIYPQEEIVSLASTFDPEKEGIRLWKTVNGADAFVHIEN